MPHPFTHPDPFITVWDTRNIRESHKTRAYLRNMLDSSTDPDQIALPVYGSSYTVHWMRCDDPAQRGQQEADGPFILDLPEPGAYRLAITGGIKQICLDNYADADKLLEIEQWGHTKWRSMLCAFQGAHNMQLSATDAPDLSLAVDAAAMFQEAHAFNAPLNHWDVSSIRTMESMFKDARSFNQDLDAWDTHDVRDMTSMFSGAEAFNGAVHSWDMSRVHRMDGMFNRASSFNQPVNDWDVSQVQHMEGVFRKATAFNQDLDRWNVRLVQYFSWFLADAQSFNGSMSGWDLMCAYDVSHMFQGARAFNQPIGDWAFYEDLYTMEEMFKGARSFNQPIGDWAIPESVNVDRMFVDAMSFDQDLSGWEAEPDPPAPDVPESSDSGKDDNWPFGGPNPFGQTS